MTVQQLIDRLKELPHGMIVKDSAGDIVVDVRIDTGETYKDLAVIISTK